MKLYDNILEFGDLFHSIRKHDDFIVVDLKLPVGWEDKKIIDSRGSKIQMKSSDNNSTHKLVSFFNLYTSEGCGILVDEIKTIIKWNKDVEEKNNLLSLKMLELKKVFSENDVAALRKLDFDFKNDKISLNGEEQNRGMVPSGSDERPEGSTTT
tara:strand:+ start:410 stop:871 length:462 start_codon:yes stop_codon:yes gene_type:complete